MCAFGCYEHYIVIPSNNVLHTRPHDMWLRNEMIRASSLCVCTPSPPNEKKNMVALYPFALSTSDIAGRKPLLLWTCYIALTVFFKVWFTGSFRLMIVLIEFLICVIFSLSSFSLLIRFSFNLFFLALFIAFPKQKKQLLQH